MLTILISFIISVGIMFIALFLASELLPNTYECQVVRDNPLPEKKPWIIGTVMEYGCTYYQAELRYYKECGKIISRRETQLKELESGDE